MQTGKCYLLEVIAQDVLVIVFLAVPQGKKKERGKKPQNSKKSHKKTQTPQTSLKMYFTFPPTALSLASEYTFMLPLV